MTERRLVRASLWVIGGLGAGQALRLIGNLILTRLLFPEAFGLMALVTILIQGLFMLSDVGVQVSIIRSERGDDESFVNTAWTIQVIRGIALSVCVGLLAYPFASFYNEPRFVSIVPVVGVTALLAGLNSTAIIVANRRLWVGRATCLELGAQVLGLVVMVVWALISASIWALVAGQIVNAAVKALLSHYIFPYWKNRFRWDRSAVNEIVHVGKWILISSILGFLASQIDKLVLGKLAPLDLVGIYSIGFMLAQLPSQVIVKWIGAVYFPLASAEFRDPANAGKAALGMRRKLNVVCGLILIALFVGAAPLFRLLYKPEYWGAIRVVEVAALGIGIQILNATYSRLNIVHGMPMLTAISALSSIVLFSASVVWFYSTWGIVGVAAAFSISQFAAYAVSAYGVWTKRQSDVTVDFAICVVASIAAWVLKNALTNFVL